ncbi:MAG: ABC transporter ATP-binding protein [Anaerolineae bacterium]|jgi:ATP-binding cassette subfamily B protein|nr:ABC transporter ATP-binding protein [Anaerolineae bacterium]MBT4310273.1 ABC transporter ATP-binding protein [Anaerolineae bacterium]MBT4460095.1 ABC transporter ATP-binding protein [Anaerolineae bacterium]MBT4842960.1 ABC transporter ATP-binding protein [Anaerolineae bacterium]MBT6061844.1 ABC transporter ATP-binding protein [Anaerolineae bacterium]
MSFFSGLDAENYDRQYTDKELTKRIAGNFSPQRKRMIYISVLVTIVALISASTPIIISRALESLETRPTMEATLLIGGGVFMIGVLNWGINWMRRALTARAIGDVVLNLRTSAFRAAADHDLSFYDKFSSGKIVSRITSDTRDFGQLVTIATDITAQLIQASILAIVLFNIEWKLTMLIVLYLPIIFIVTSQFRKAARKVTRNGMRAMADVNATIKETVSGISVAKNFRQEMSIFETFNTANQDSYRVNVRRGFVLALVFPILNALGGIATAIMVYVGGWSVMRGGVTAAAWYLFILSLNHFLFPMMNLSAFWAQIQQGLSAAERVYALIDAEPNVLQEDDEEVEQAQGKVRFENVDFHYIPSEPILTSFNLLIPPGQSLALVGHTGAGKSSIAKLIARFYEFQSGKLTVDGRDIRSFDLTSYRRQLGIVSQVPFLFSGTVAENIRYARPEATETEILKMAKKIGDGEWLETLPSGLESEVGERGARLSMGQRQLVALMRVLVQNPAIFILDEATASIDPFTEWQIQQALNLILENTTSILIAHRLSTIKSADKILVMENGGIIEEGNHDNLLAQKGHYAELYNTYFRHQSLAYIENAQEFIEEE